MTKQSEDTMNDNTLDEERVNICITLVVGYGNLEKGVVLKIVDGLYGSVQT